MQDARQAERDPRTSVGPSPDRTPPLAGAIAILGTGKMGSAIATRLSEAGFQVILWNRT